MGYAIERDDVFLRAHPEYVPTNDEHSLFEGCVARRTGREPFHYIVGSKEFYGLDFELTPDVLIPRPETEMLVEESIARASKIDMPSALEIGVGSGCISVSILKHVERSEMLGVDISQSAIAIARRNAERHGVGDRFITLVSDVYEHIPAGSQFDLIVSNPPYIRNRDMKGLEPEVRDFEPAQALTDFDDGLGIIRNILRSAGRFVKPGGFLLLEFGIGQENEVLSLFGGTEWALIETKKDLRSIPRIVIAQKAG